MVTNLYTAHRQQASGLLLGQFSGNWREDYLESNMPVTDLVALWRYFGAGSPWRVSSATAVVQAWEPVRVFDVTTSGAAEKGLLIRNLGWTLEAAMETRMRLRAFEEDWNAPGMEAYDEL